MLPHYLHPRQFLLHVGLLGFGFVTANTGAAAEDLTGLKSHWNFDEARDWHNMPFPFSQPVTTADDSVGTNGLSLNDKLDPVKSWASGRQFSGIRFDSPGQFLQSRQPLDTLKGSATLSYWIKTDTEGTADSPPGIVGDVAGMQWGIITPEGKLAVVQNGKVLATTSAPVNDNEWHHIVIMRKADSGQVVIFLDGKLSGKGTGTPGILPGEYTGFGAIQGGGGYKGLLDQIHLFDKPIDTNAVGVLFDNHAPKAYPQDALVTRGKPSQTGSILHLYTFDPDQDKLSVSRYGQSKFGTVKYNGDGTFTYTSGANFKGRDSFSVTVADGRGGFSTTRIDVGDETTVPKSPVSKFTSFRDLPPIGEGSGKTGSRIPVSFDWDSNGKPDLLVCGNNRIWAYKNQKGQFSAPSVVKDDSGKELEAASIAILPQPRKKIPLLIVRTNDGTLHTYELQPSAGNSPIFQKTGTIVNDQEGDFKCPSNALAFGDFDNDGLPDLLVGNSSSGLFFHKNVGKPGQTKLKTEAEHIVSNSYNLAPYFADLNRDGKPDLLHGINWGSIHYWINKGGKNILDTDLQGNLILTDEKGNIPKKGDNTVLRAMNGTFGALDDFNGDGIIDIVLGAYNDGMLSMANGVSVNAAARNLAAIEKIYRGHEKDLGKVLEANNQELLNRYRNLSREWITWAVSLPSAEYREKAYQMLKNHIAKFPFLKRGKLDAWVKKDKDGNTTFGPMHHVPGIFVMNWVTLHCMKPDSAEHRIDVANTLGLQGLDRERYLASGLALADNNKCTEGQLLAIRDFLKYHPRVLFPDDHISIDQNMGDGREAMAYVFKSNKNTFGNDVGGPACESAGDLKEAAEKYLGKGAATGDYFTFVMGHEICHSLDAYVYGRKNKDLAKRWNEMLIYAANNGGETEVVVPGEDGWIDQEKTRERFKEKNLWDGITPWNQTWDNYWHACPYKDLTFMRGNIGWFLAAKQETLATQANHNWAGSEARLVGAIDRYNRGYKANINEVVLFLDFLSAGLNKVPMYSFTVTQNPNRVQFNVQHSWLERNDNGYITKISVGPHVYEFDVDDRGKVIAIKNHPFMKEMAQTTTE